MTTSSPPPDEKLPDRHERLERVSRVLNQVSRDIGPALNLQAVLQIVLNGMRSLVSFTTGSIAILGDDGLQLVASDPPTRRELDQDRVPIGQGIAGRVLATAQPLLSGNVADDPRMAVDGAERSAAAGVVSILAVPLVALGQVIGTLQVTTTEIDAFTEDDLMFLEALATQAAGAIESARRYESVAELEVMKSDFIARVSHELRTPITIVSGFVSTLLTEDEALGPDERRRMLQRIDGAAARLSGLIDELLMLARLEAGVVAAEIRPVGLGPVAFDACRQSSHPEQVTVEVPAKDVIVDTDPALLGRAVGFLVDNALKYAGSCRLIVTEEPSIEVVDDGPGIGPDERSHVFERFTRSQEHTTVPGMGLGLPMAQTLLGAVGAALTLDEPVDGMGTRMVIRL
ncbi:MAG: GAF domain-containing protein [Acidobacteria bacterium]|nr:GAF domain-containing protein [Acidobacteriota bacterium]